jgi:Spy/CpxP family protein refolding chaperone
MAGVRSLHGFALLALSLATPSVAAGTQTESAVPLADRGDEIVCRKEKETGSLVKTRKTCHSRAQWQYIDEVNQSQTRAMQDDMRTRQRGD